ASPSSHMLRIMANTVPTVGHNRVKPSVYLRPMAQPISSRPAVTRMTQAMRFPMRLVVDPEIHPKLDTVFLEAQALVELVDLGTCSAARGDELVATRLARGGDDFAHERGAEPAAALRLVDEDVFEKTERFRVQIVRHHVQVRARDLAASAADREPKALCRSSLPVDFHLGRNSRERSLSAGYCSLTEGG